MKLKSIIIVFVFLAFLMARDVSTVRNTAPQPRAVVEQVITNPISNDFSGSTRNNTSRTDTTTIWFDDLEGDVSGWQVSPEWSLTETSSYSPTHSFNVDDDSLDISSDLTSPSITLPTIDSDNQLIKFSFALWCDMPDHDGDGDNTLEDYYRVWVANVSETQGTYPDATVERLESPSVTLTGTSPELNFKLNYSIEAYAGDPQTIDGCEINGWDAANVRISTDDGTTWNVLTGSPAYTYTSCYGWSANGDGCDIPGWGGVNAGGWVDANYDLSAYVGQSIKIAFYFGADPNTNDTGLFIDDVLITNATNDTLLFDNADDSVVLTPVSVTGTTTYFHTDTYQAYSGNSWWFGLQDFVWEVVFYDYGEDTRPGGTTNGWTEYLPGFPFDNPPVGDINVQLDLSEFAGDDIQLKWTAITDDNQDGGNGSGLYIDDIHVWQVNLQEGPPPLTGLSAVAGDRVVHLTWDDIGTGFNGLIQYDNGNWDGNGIGGVAGWAGNLFDAPFGIDSVTVNSIDVYGYDNYTIDLAGFSVNAGIPNETYDFTTNVTLTAQQWNNIPVTDWVFNGDFIIATEIGTDIYQALDVTASPSSHAWIKTSTGIWEEYPVSDLPDGEWLIRANVTSVGGAAVTYNVYRNINGGDYFLHGLGTGISVPEMTDNWVANDNTYCYKVAALFDGVEGDQTEPVCATPEAQTIHELSYDDGDANTSNNMGNGNFIAVKFTPLAYPSKLIRLKYFMEGATGGVAVRQIWDDDGASGMPGTSLNAPGAPPIIALIQGWNEISVATENITINNGSFYVGYQETPNTPPFGIDNDSPPDYSFVNYTGSWEPFSNIWSGAIMIRVDVDSAGATSGIGYELQPDIPKTYALAQNYPNPFNPTTKIEFDLPEAGIVELTLYDVTGQLARNIVGRHLSAGHYQYQLDAGDLASGIYFYHLRVYDNGRQMYSATRKLMLIK